MKPGYQWQTCDSSDRPANTFEQLDCWNPPSLSLYQFPSLLEQSMFLYVRHYYYYVCILGVLCGDDRGGGIDCRLLECIMLYRRYVTGAEWHGPGRTIWHSIVSDTINLDATRRNVSWHRFDHLCVICKACLLPPGKWQHG